MKNEKMKTIKIEKLFKAKGQMHKELSKMSFEEKIDALYRLQIIAKNFKPA